MKIGFVLDDRLDKPDGVQQYVSLLGSWLTSEGNEVHYLVGDSPNALQKNVHSLGKTINVRFNKNRMSIPLPARMKNIRELLEKEQFDILHVQMPYSPLLAGKVVRAAPKNTAIVGTFHILPHGKLSALGTKALGVLLTKNKKKFAAFISVSSAAQTFARSHFGISSVVLPNVVNLSSFQKGSPIASLQDKTNIVFLGRFVERKGVHLLVAAYKKLLQDKPQLKNSVRLVLCGDGPSRAHIEELAGDIRSSGGDVVLTGFLKEDDKKQYLASARLAVFPSTGGESFGIVLIEAMAAGSYVVLGGNNEGYATVLGGQPESLIHAQNTTMFARQLQTFLTDTKACDELHKKQQTLVKKYDITHVGPQIVAVYEQILVKRQRKVDT